jgi:hypothetical protein
VVAAGWRFQVWVRQTEVNSTQQARGRVLSVHARAAVHVLPCPGELHLTSAHTHTYDTTSHLTHSAPIDLTSIDLTYIHSPLNPFQSLPPLPLPAVYPRSAYRKHLSKPGAAGPENHQASRGNHFPASNGHTLDTTTPHSHVEISSFSPYEWPAPPSPLEHEVVIRVPKVA